MTPGNIGKYQTSGVLGRGAMGIVYDGWDPSTDRRVAIKTVKLPRDDDDEQAQDILARFKREAKAGGGLIHPNVVTVFDSGETADVAYMVMEFIDGDSLKRVLAANARVTAGDAVALMLDILAGLAFSHARKVVHRDIKPDNIMITRDRQAKLVDFGIAHIEGSGLTQPGTVMGTWAYMSPEQLSGHPVDHRTDIYSCGVLLYQLLTGDCPFDGSPTAIVHKVMTTTPPRPSELAVTAPIWLDRVVARAMARRPDDRYGSAAEFAQALRAGAAAAALPDENEAEPDGTVMQPASARARYHAVPQPAARPAATPAPAVAPRRIGMVPLIFGGGSAVAAAAAIAIWLAWPKQPAAPIGLSRVPIPEPLPGQPGPGKPDPFPRQPYPDPGIPPIPPDPLPRPLQLAPITAISTRLLSGKCSFAHAISWSDGSMTVTGIADAVQEEPLRRAAGVSSPAAWRVQTFNGPYCAAVDLLRSQEATGQTRPGLQLSQSGGSAVLLDKAIITLQVTMPGFGGSLHMGYLQHDGTVFVLVPGKGFPPRTYLAGEQIDLGAPRGDFEGWQVGAPFGSDMVVAVASTAALFPPDTTTFTSMSSYLTALQKAVDNLRRHSGSVAATALILETRAVR